MRRLGSSRLGSTALSLALVGVITLAAVAGPLLVAAAVVLVQLLIAAAPSPADSRGRLIHAPRFAAAASAGLVATVLTLWPGLLEGADGSTADVSGTVGTGLLGGIIPAIAVGIFVAMVSQMLRKDGRPHLVPSTGYAVSLGVFAAMSVGWIGATQSLGDWQAVAIGAAGVAGGLLAWMVPIDRWVCGALAVVTGAAAGAAAALAVDSVMTWLFGVVIGSGASLFAVLGQALGRTWSQGRAHASAGWGFPGVMSIALAAPIVYVGGQLVGARGF